VTITDEMLMAYADGELDSATRAEVARAIGADPSLTKRVEQHRALQAKLKGAYDPVLTEPMPERLRKLADASGSASVTDLAATRAARNAKPSARRLSPIWLPIAASTVFGVLVGFLLFGGRDRQDLAADGVIVKGDMARALSEQLASAPSERSPLRIGTSYESNSGNFCRTFVTANESSLAGVACHAKTAARGEWRIRMLVSAGPNAVATYRTAASAMPAAIVNFVAGDLKGEAFDAEREAQGVANGWSPP